MRKQLIGSAILLLMLCAGIFAHSVSGEARELKDTGAEADLGEQIEDNAPVLELHDENGNIVLNWSKVNEAWKYVIYRSRTGDISENDMPVYSSEDTEITTYTDNYVSSDYYYYQVVAYCGDTRLASNIVRYDRPVGKVDVVKAVAAEDGYIAVGFQKAAGNPAGYEIYRSESGQDGSFILIKDVEDSGSIFMYGWEIEDLFPEGYEYFKDNDLQIGGTYFYRIRAYEIRNGERIYGEFSVSVSAQSLLDSVKPVSAKQLSYHSILLKWKKLNNAHGYIIRRSLHEEGPYEDIADISLSETIQYIDENLACGVTYYYQIYGYTVLNGVKISGQAGTTVSAKPQLGKVKSMSSKTKTPTRMTISWKAVEGAQGYIVYKMNGNKKYKQMKKTSASARTAKLKVRNGVAYNFKIVAYRMMEDGSEALGEEAQFTAYGDYYGYGAEGFDSKYKRIYKKGNQYKSDSAARKYMATIKVKVWDFRSGMSGAKITKTKYITCNKAIAPTLKKIFNKIYHGKEKAPIYEAGGYSWRTGQHGQGLAVDLNSNYNAMFDNGKTTAGSCWNPKKYAYSIKRNGDIEKAFEEYGFSRGFWGSRKDYMHFSYFGT